MEQTTNGANAPKKHLTLEERLAQLERKEQKAKEAEAKRKAKIAKLRSAMLTQKRENFEKLLTANGIQTESQLDEAMELHHLLNTWGVVTKSQLEDVLNAAEQGDPTLMEKLLEEKEQRERKSQPHQDFCL